MLRCDSSHSVVVALSVVVIFLAQDTTCAGYGYDPSDFATEVVEYVEGSGIPNDPISGQPFNVPTTALGRPTIDTTGDGWDIPIDQIVPIVQVYSPFRSFEVVTVGHGGHIALQFDHPVANEARNPYGLDFIVFGNASQLTGSGSWTNGNPNDTTVDSSGGLIEPGTVSVSQDGQTWYTFSSTNGPHADSNGPYAGADGPVCDVFAPTLGRIYDEENPDTSIGLWNQWWGEPTDPTVPLDPRLTWSDFYDKTVAGIAQTNGLSAGGTGFDLEWLEQPGLDWIQYVRVDGPAEGGTPEVDAVSDVFPHLGDFDRDGDVDLADFARFQRCSTGSGGASASRECFCGDFDRNLVTGDKDVDSDDYKQFAQYLTGPNPLK